MLWNADLTDPMRTGQDQDEDKQTYVLATEAPILKLAEERQNRILDANYEVIDLDAKVNVMDSLSEHQKEQLRTTLKMFPTLFSKGLGTIDTGLIHLNIKEGTTLTHSKPYPVPKHLRYSPRHNFIVRFVSSCSPSFSSEPLYILTCSNQILIQQLLATETNSTLLIPFLTSVFSFINSLWLARGAVSPL